MAKVAPFHTTTPEDGAGHRNVYHDQSECHYGKAIKAADRVAGMGNRPKCDRCKELG
jgi:hypothetical protein